MGMGLGDAAGSGASPDGCVCVWILAQQLLLPDALADRSSASSLLPGKPSCLLHATRRSVRTDVKYETPVSYQYLCGFFVDSVLAKLWPN